MSLLRGNEWISAGACSLCLALAIMSYAGAAPATWFLWQSSIDGALTCKQTSPGRGWRKVAGPYEDLRCNKPVRSTRPESTAQA